VKGWLCSVCGREVDGLLDDCPFCGEPRPVETGEN